MPSFFGLILLGFTFGAVAVLAIQALGLLWIIKRLRHNHKPSSSQIQLDTSSKQLDHQQSLHFAFHKQVHFPPLFHLCYLSYYLLCQEIRIEMILKFFQGRGCYVMLYY
jgi:hypothetical protein